MKEIKSKKSFLTLLIATCLILATAPFVTDISAEGESCLNNLNAIFLSNAEELMEVQATRLVNDELNTAAENWTLEELNEFLEDLEEDEDDQGEDEDGDLEFKPGYLSADQTFTAMVSYGFIPEDSGDLEAYRELYHDPYSLEGNVSTMRNFQVLKQYDFIPSSISQSDFRKLGGRMGLIIRGFEYPIPPEYIDIQVSKWTEAGIVTTNESWLHTDYDGFEDDIEAAQNSSSNVTEIFEQLLLVYKEYGFIPQNKTLDDLFEYLEEQYYENQELIDDYHDEYGWEGSEERMFCHIHGFVRAGFTCFRVPIIPFLYYSIDSDSGGLLSYVSYGVDRDSLTGGIFQLEIVIFFPGLWIPPPHNGWNILPRIFYGFAYYISFNIY